MLLNDVLYDESSRAFRILDCLSTLPSFFFFFSFSFFFSFDIHVCKAQLTHTYHKKKKEGQYRAHVVKNTTAAVFFSSYCFLFISIRKGVTAVLFYWYLTTDIGSVFSFLFLLLWYPWWFLRLFLPLQSTLIMMTPIWHIMNYDFTIYINR